METLTISAMETIAVAKNLAEKAAELSSTNSALTGRVAAEENKTQFVCAEESYIDSEIQILESTLRLIEKSHSHSNELFANSMDTLPLLARLKQFSEMAEPDETAQHKRVDKLRKDQTRVIEKYEASATFKKIVETEACVKEIEDLKQERYKKRHELDRELDDLQAQLIDLRNI